MILICKYCGEKFETNNSNQSFCSKSCSGKYQQQNALESIQLYKNERIERYYKNPNVCKCCGNVLKYDEKTKSFCNRSCAATYNNSKRVRKPWSEEQRSNQSKIISEKNKDKHSSDLNRPTYTPREKVCKYCGKKFTSQLLPNGKYSGSKFCSNECKKLNNIEIGKRAIVINKEKGAWKPWQTRNISSYPEKFFEKVLNNNSITFIREKYIDGYFLDFYIIKGNRIIDLEIDGKQHNESQEKDHNRDEYLKEKNIEVYRIKWNSINSLKGKEKMKVKIDNFFKIL